MALVGETRITEILANVILPWRQVQERAAWPDFSSPAARPPDEPAD